MNDRSTPLSILFSSSESFESCFPNVTSDFEIQLANGVVLKGSRPVRAVGLSTTEILIQAAVTVGSGVATKVLGEILSKLISKARPTPKIQIGKVVVATGDGVELEKALEQAFHTSQSSPTRDEDED